MPFKLDRLTAVRTNKKDYTISGIYNAANTTVRSGPILIDTLNTKLTVQLDNFADPNNERVEFESSFDFESVKSDIDCCDLVLDQEKTASRSRTVNHLLINDLTYPPPYKGKSVSMKEHMLLPFQDHSVFTRLFTIEQLDVTRNAGDKFGVDVHLTYNDQENDYVVNSYALVIDPYNEVDDLVELEAIVLYVDTVDPDPARAKELAFTGGEFDLKHYYPQGIPVIITFERTGPGNIDWSRIALKKAALAFH